MENKDFKYVMHDLTNLYIGAKHTYNELLVLEEVPFKLKTLEQPLDHLSEFD